MVESGHPLWESVRRRWWTMLLQGIICMGVGLYLFGRPGETMVVIALLIGIQALACGILDIYASISNRTGRSRIWALVSGVLLTLAGVMFLAQPSMMGILNTSVVVYTVAILFILAGVADMMGVRLNEYGEYSWSWGGMLIGILKILFGVLLIAHPLFSGAVMMNMTSFTMIVLGVAIIGLSFNIRSSEKPSDLLQAG